MGSLFTLQLSLPGFSLLLATTFQVTNCCEEGYDRDSFLMLILFLCSLNSSQRQREMIRVSEENRTLLVRLQKVQPHYRANDWVNQYTHTHTHTHAYTHTHTHTHTHTRTRTHALIHTTCMVLVATNLYRTTDYPSCVSTYYIPTQLRALCDRASMYPCIIVY